MRLRNTRSGKSQTPGQPDQPVRRWRRFVVAEDSMLPSYRPGDGLVTRRTGHIRRGEVRVFEHPARPGFWLVKRVGDIVGDHFFAVSDAPSPVTVDSRSFGLVPVAGSYRVVARVPFSKPRTG